jgi:hypothetical protein
MIRKIITDFDKSILACSEHRSEPHGAMGEGASLIEADNLHTRNLNGLFRLSAIDAILA